MIKSAKATAMPHALTALSPLDGRYASKTRALQDHFSEFALIRLRVRVEIAWLKALAADPAFDLLPAFSAAFLGATAIQPGRFNPFGAVAAVYFLATGITGLQQLGVDTFVQQLFYGGALVLAVALSQLVRRRRAIEFSPAE